MEIPKSCKAGRVINPGPEFKVVLDDVPVPEPGDDELLLKLNVTGLCYSDIHYMLEDLPMAKMTDTGIKSAGHEGIGTVVKLGKNVTSWKIGDRGGVKPLWDVCHDCELCFGGYETHCPRGSLAGLHKPGTYQSYLVSPARYTTRIPDEVDDFVAAPLMCAGATMFSSIRAANLTAGSWVVFLGAGGGVGHVGLQIAKAMGMRVIGIDSGDSKRDLCLRLGCASFVDFANTSDVAAEVMSITQGRGAKGIFVTATSPSAYQLAPSLAGVGGRVMCIGLTPTGQATVGADPALFVGKNLHIIGTMVGSMRDAHEVLQLAAAGLVKPVYTVFPAAKLPEAVEELRSGKSTARYIVDFNA